LPHWYVLPATIAGDTATFTITAGGLGDDDLSADGTIVDQGGPGIPPAGSVAVPAMNIWGTLLFMLLAGLLALYRLGRRKSA
jgi:hypothetical protein